MNNETTNNVGGIAADRLRSIIERVERHAQRDDALARRGRDEKGRFR